MAEKIINTSKVWRYLDLAKFIHLITTKTLHFTRLDQFKDKFEGSYPLKNISDWERLYPEVGDFEGWRKFICVSCWYKSEKESAAMWELYGSSGQGLAICSSIDQLVGSIRTNGSVENQEIQYLDFINDKAEISTPLEIWKYKRIEFEHEHEFRLALTEIPPTAGFENGLPINGSVENQEGFPKEGLDIPVKLKELIEKIVLSPYTQKWYKEVVKRLVGDNGLAPSKIEDSALAVDPVYPKQ